MVANSLVYHPSVAHYLRYVATTVGRDKLLRTLQYFARFYAWYLYRTNAAASQVAPWDAIKKQFGLTRKILRFGKNVEHLKAAAVAADAAPTMDPFLRYATIGRQLGYAGYLSFDAATLPDALGIRRSPRTKTLQREAYRFWAVGILCSVFAQLYTLNRLRQRQARVDLKEAEGAVENKRIAMCVSHFFFPLSFPDYLCSCAPRPRCLTSVHPLTVPAQHAANPSLCVPYRERSQSRMQLLCDLCDLTVPVSGLNWLSLDDGIVGITGTVSSLVGVYTQWKKTA